MANARLHGQPPYRFVVIHGGPGAPGYMAAVARELASDWGVLEPLQTESSVEGQLMELHGAIRDHCDTPVTLIGSSWGALLGFMYSGRFPDVVSKLILVGSAVYDEKYAENIMETRLSRLSLAERAKAERRIVTLQDENVASKDKIFSELGTLLTKADAYDPLTLDIEVMETQFDLHRSVWRDAESIRRAGRLLELGRQIQCPVVAMHGDYDPHPVEGIQTPLESVLSDFRFVLLEQCGHYPWIERHAKNQFFATLREECTGHRARS